MEQSPSHKELVTVQYMTKDEALKNCVDEDLKRSPARSPRGRIRNLKAMSDQKFWNLAFVMNGYASADPEAADAVLAECARRECV